MSARNYRSLLADFVRQIAAIFPSDLNPGLLYFAIGNFILDNENRRDYNRELLYRLFRDLQKHRGVKRRMSMPNPSLMRKVAAAYRQAPSPIHQKALKWLSWEHHPVLVSKIADPTEQLFYLELAYLKNWTCEEMLFYIELDLYSGFNRA